ncbi:hypothetical protein ACQY0O_008050 [Thecaphora frezii]
MTRYTKLGSRREVPAKPDSPVPAAEATHSSLSASAPAASSSVTSSANPSASDASAASASDASTSTPTPAAAAAATAPSAAQEPKPKTKEQLLKRAKLLKLKAKKAKTPEAKKKFLKQAWDLEKESDALSYPKQSQNGSKRPHDDSAGGRGVKRSRPAEEAGEAETEANPWKRMFKEQQATAMDKSEARRLKRIEERAAKTKCFACRGLGHEARDCPKALDAESNRLAEGGDKGKDEKAGITGRETVGICFRCGSTQHTLAKCRKQAPKVGEELPFATCFVCGKRGHLSSKCPNNNGRGVYPEGGCCKLCSSVDHLARDCPLALSRQDKLGNNAAVETAGLIDAAAPASNPEEDHFHTLARNRRDVDQHNPKVENQGKKNKVVVF